MSRAAIYLVLVIACSSKTEPPRAEPPPGFDDSPSPRVVEAREPEPAPGRLDQEPPGRTPGRPPQARAVRPIEVVLRSSPPGATATVDGKPIGQTPAYWAGEADGREHEFAFLLPGHASARYRFVPITSGVIHARLDVLADEPDAGVPPEQIHVPLGAVAPPPRSPPATPDAVPAPSEATSSGAGHEP